MGYYSITVHNFSHLLEQGVARAWLFFPTAVILRALHWKLAKPHGGRSEHSPLAPVCVARNNAHASTDPELLARNTELQVFKPPANKISFHYARSKSCCTIE
jgi:hypothetical protein